MEGGKFGTGLQISLVDMGCMLGAENRELIQKYLEICGIGVMSKWVLDVSAMGDTFGKEA